MVVSEILNENRILRFESIKIAFRLPWNQESSVGLCGEILFDLLIGNCYLIYGGAYLMLFNSMCFFYQAFLDIFEYSLCELNYSNGIPNRQTEMIRKLVRFHIMIK